MASHVVTLTTRKAALLAAHDRGVRLSELVLLCDPVMPVRDGLARFLVTRMHNDPRQGVVDEHCRVHGVRNLSVAGSSVFRRLVSSIRR